MMGKWWCRWFHGRPFWPIHGRYICPRCLRVHLVDWAVNNGK